MIMHDFDSYQIDTDASGEQWFLKAREKNADTGQTNVRYDIGNVVCTARQHADC